ncbi:hypothetical protein BH23GEM2_BH23GEM2_19320 [soil metagenome]
MHPLNKFLIAGALALFLAGALLLRQGGSSTNASSPEATLTPSEGTEIVAVFLATEDCLAASTPGFDEELKGAITRLRNETRSTDRRFVYVGGALSNNTRRAREFMARFGPYDELVVGRGWLNSTAVYYMWRDIPGGSRLPQIVILQRSVEVLPEGIRISPDSVLLRVSGVEAIRAWAAAGSPIG